MLKWKCLYSSEHTLQVDTAEDEERVERVQELCSALLLSDEQLQHIGRDTLCTPLMSDI